jgi:hypothetical protein
LSLRLSERLIVPEHPLEPFQILQRIPQGPGRRPWPALQQLAPRLGDIPPDGHGRIELVQRFGDGAQPLGDVVS